MAATLTGVSRPELVLRLGILGEKQFVQDTSLYDVLLVGANLVQGFGAGVAALLAGTRGGARPFLIDPMTHAFAHKVEAVLNSAGEPKRTLKALAQGYAGFLGESVGKTPVTDKTFGRPGRVDELAKSVLRYQLTALSEKVEPKYRKYLESQLTPAAVVCPYFHASRSTYSRWWPVNRELVEASASVSLPAGVRRLAMVCVDEDMLTDGAADSWVADYASLAVDGYAVWVSGLEEPGASRGDIEALRGAVSDLSDGGRRTVHKVYGGYLSMLLWHVGLSGISYGPGYGEERRVSPVGGGLPQPKFYLPDLHQRLDAVAVARVLPETVEEYRRTVCDCPECTGAIAHDVSHDFHAAYMETGTTTAQRADGRSQRIVYATQGTRERTTRHYLHSRAAEATWLGTHDIADAVGRLRDAATRYEDCFGLDAVAYLRDWADTLCSPTQCP